MTVQKTWGQAVLQQDVLVGYRMKEEAKGSQQQILLGILNYNYAPYLDHNV